MQAKTKDLLSNLLNLGLQNLSLKFIVTAKLYHIEEWFQTSKKRKLNFSEVIFIRSLGQVVPPRGVV